MNYELVYHKLNAVNYFCSRHAGKVVHTQELVVVIKTDVTVILIYLHNAYTLL